MESQSYSNRFLLCRPLGGLNDVLCQIEYARRIAKRAHRKLIVQTEPGSPSLRHRFGRPFSELFFSLDQRISVDLSQLKSGLAQSTNIYPKRYQLLGTWLDVSLEERTGGSEVQCRLEKNPPREPDLVVHEGFGGGTASFRLLEHLNISPNVLDPTLELVRELPNLCAAVHFRNTDYKSSYERLKEAVERVDTGSSILIATDDDSVLARLREDYSSREFISASSVVKQASPRSPVEAALQEMILLASCSHLELVPLDIGESSIPNFSGFGRLTQHIWTVRQIQKHGVSVLLSELIKLSFESPRRRRNPIRFMVFAAIRGAELFAHSYRPRGVYRQLMKTP